jgi:hypothetical protein
MAEIAIKLTELMRPKGQWLGMCEMEEVERFLKDRFEELGRMYPGLTIYRDYDMANDTDIVRLVGLPDDVAQEILAGFTPQLEP